MKRLSDGKDKSEKSISRRSLMKSVVAAGVFAPLSARGSKRQARRNQHIAVIGAGAFGGWTALYLLRQGVKVTLLDTWGPGNSRASSGGETRVIRGTYGADRIYTQMAARAFRLWAENERRWNLKLYRRTGALWMFGKDDKFAKDSMPLLREVDFAYKELTVAEAKKRYPQINFEGVNSALYEQEAGYLLARRACEAVLEGFLKEGGEYRQLLAKPGDPENKEIKSIALSDGSTLVADQYVFACGPWLGKLFPHVIGNLIRPTRQEVFYFGTPLGDARFFEDSLPIWVDYKERVVYGIPGNERRGFKLADDTRGPLFDPTSGDRTPTAQGIKAARDFIAHRFPSLRGAPLLEARVCQYEESPDGHFIIDRHPQAANVWLVGGGSGHGFKHGPALGEEVCKIVLGEKSSDPLFLLSRLAARTPKAKQD